jgi:hypothetical protein
MRREVFLLSSLGLAEHISKTIESVTVASQSLSSASIEEYGRALQSSPASRTFWQPIYNPAEALPNFNNPKPPPGETVSEGSLDLWSLLDNHEGVLSQHYYEKLIFPKSEVETLKPSLKLYYRNMFPVPVYRNQKTGAIIWRSGHYSADAKQVSLTLDANERLLDLICRSSELSQGTPGVRVLETTDTASIGIASQIQLPWGCSSENLPSPSFLTTFEAFHAIRVICSGGPWKALKLTPEDAPRLKEPLIDANFAPHCKRWMRKLSNSSWQVCVSKTLAAACSVVAAVTKEGVSVLVESGTSMVVSVLAQLLVNPIFRTIRGFAKVRGEVLLSLLLCKLLNFNSFPSFQNSSY